MPKLTKDEALKTLQGLEASEVFLMTPEENTSYLENYKKVEIEKELKGRIAKVYDDLDADFAAITGQRKPDTEKTYKYWPGVVKQLKEAAENADADKLRKQIDELKKTGASPELMKELEAVRAMSISEKKKYESRIAELEGVMVQKDITVILNEAMRGLQFQKLPQAVLDAYVEKSRSKLMTSAKIVNGELVFHDEKGEPMINQTTYKPYTAAELMARELEPVIESEKKKGLGSQEPNITKRDGKIEVTLNVPHTLRSKTELTEFLIKNGLPFNTPEYYAAYDKYQKQLGL